MRRAKTPPAEDLSRAVGRLPVHTRRAMLEAVRCPQTRLITGAYVSGEGACPLLAAHRRGGRENGRSTFAAAWDRFTRTPTGRPRPVSAVERRALETVLVASLRGEGAGRPRPAKQSLALLRYEAPPLPAGAAGADSDRTAELRHECGWSWTRVFRRLDEYEAAVAAAREAETTTRTEEHVPVGA